MCDYFVGDLSRLKSGVINDALKKDLEISSMLFLTDLRK